MGSSIQNWLRFPWETICVLKENEDKKYGKYPTPLDFPGETLCFLKRGLDINKNI